MKRQLLPLPHSIHHATILTIFRTIVSPVNYPFKVKMFKNLCLFSCLLSLSLAFSRERSGSDSDSGESGEFSLRDKDAFGAASKILVEERTCSHLELNTVFITRSRCGVFYVCQPYQGYVNLFQYTCPKDQVFDHSLLQCNPDLTCDQLINVLRPEYPVCPGKSVYSDPIQAFRVTLYDPGETFCGSYLTCDGGEVTMYQCDNDRVFNETKFLCDFTLSCEIAGFVDVPVNCEDTYDLELWHRDPEHPNKAWFCKRNREKENDWITSYQYCQAGQIVKSEVSYRFECIPASSRVSIPPKQFICDEVGNHPSTKSCTEFWHCHETFSGKLTPHLVKCLDGFYFDNEKESCVPGSCPSQKTTTETPPVSCEKVPSKWSCERHGQFYLHPRDCSKYYQCSIPEGKEPCISPIKECPHKLVFDNATNTCGHTRCPKLSPIVPPGTGWKCSQEGEAHVLPGQGKNCSKYYTCTRCVDCPYWCYKVGQCPEGQMFDDSSQKCQSAKICPQEPKPASGKLTCEGKQRTRVNPFDCSKYYTCEWNKSLKEIAVIDFSCPPYEFYDDDQKSCVIGKCPQCFDPLPSNWPECTEHKAKLSHPHNCTQYVKCIFVKKCTHRGKPYWGHIVGFCDHGEYFDAKKQRCVPGTCKSPPKELEKGMTCKNEGELKVHPFRCYAYYKCIFWTPGSYWGFEPFYCPPGQTYHASKQLCVPGRCPQWKPLPFRPTPKPTEPPSPLPPLEEFKIIPGMTCSADHERHIFPRMERACNQYYECLQCDHDWCYVSGTCPPGQWFNDKEKVCRESKECPNPLECSFIGEKFPFPEDCTKFYRCDTCKSDNCAPDQLITEVVSCPDGESYKPNLHRCRPGSCKDLNATLTDSLCKYKGEAFPHPTECSKYYRCEKCRGKMKSCKISLQLKTCPPGEGFNGKTLACQSGMCNNRSAAVNTSLSSNQTRSKTTTIECRSKGDLLPHVDSCSKYFKCLPCTGYGCKKPDKLVLYVASCPKGQVFDPKVQICTTGQCKSPKGSLKLSCMFEGEKYYSPGPGCNEYFECILCEGDEWCFDYLTCPSGYFYDDSKKTCKHVDTCPNQIPAVTPTAAPKPPVPSFARGHSPASHGYSSGSRESSGAPGAPGYSLASKKPKESVMCTTKKEKIPHPTDCTKYFKCVPCTEPSCPEKMTTLLGTCIPGFTFHPVHKKCEPSKGLGCKGVADIPGEIKCSYDGEKNLVPGLEGSCDQYYSCAKCADTDGLCVKQYKCKSGRLYDYAQQKCRKLDKCPVPEKSTSLKKGASKLAPVPIPTDRSPPVPVPTAISPPSLPFNPNLVCDRESLKLPLPNECFKYVQCEEIDDDRMIVKEKRCQEGRYFDASAGKCVPGKCPGSDAPQANPEPTTVDQPKCEKAEKMIDPTSCVDFWFCQDGSSTPKKKRCSKDSFFHRTKLKCKPGTCPY